MKLFTCAHCGQYAYFENTYCEQCKQLLGFAPESLELKTLDRFNNDNNTLNFQDRNTKLLYRYCSNYEYGVCNWLIPADSKSALCKACELNRIIPDLSQSKYFSRWKSLEWAKHRLVYSLLRMHLPLKSKIEDTLTGLLFDFMADDNAEDKILTGHDDGVITINIAEADDSEREMARKSMHEMYRTVLGHFRHEVGHYYWDRLIFNNQKKLNEFRQLFGNEQVDYEEALKKHYQQGPRADWSVNYISAYASSHPWEDWAETWAHYLHIVDTLETAYSFGIKMNPLSKNASEIKQDPYEVKDFAYIMNLWLPLTFTMNSLNRSMGLRDAYPFIITPSVVSKLSFIHNLIRELPAQINATQLNYQNA